MTKTFQAFLVVYFFVVFFLSAPLSFAEVRFVQLTDPHLFEVPGKEKETSDSLVYFNHAIDRTNELEASLNKNNQHLDFIILTGDLGIEKLIKKFPIDKADITKKGKLIIEEDNKFFELKKDQDKWGSSVTLVANIIVKSEIKLWLLLPGNNDLYAEMSETVSLYGDFVNDVKELVKAKDAKFKIVDFRLEAKDKIGKFLPGTLKIGDNLFIGWDNSFFKNNYSIKRFLNKDNKPKPIEQLVEYKSLHRLSNAMKQYDAKYVYIFYHIPEIDDPWRINFEIDPDDLDDNTVSKTLREAAKISPKLTKGIYPYSAWMVPIEIRKIWENLITDVSKPTEVKGLFAGHFHDNQRTIYEGFGWLRDTRYRPEILSILHVAPSVSIKNQVNFGPKDRSRGGQFVHINDVGDTKVERLWFEDVAQ